MGDSRIKDISALLSSFFDEEKLRKGERASEFFSSWSSLVGQRLAAHSRVVDVEKGLLVVEAEHPGWIQLLQLRQSSIIENVSRRFPELGLRGIVFRLSVHAVPARAMPDIGEKEAIVPPEDSVEAETQAHTLDDISDPDFRELLRSLKKTMQGKADH